MKKHKLPCLTVLLSMTAYGFLLFSSESANANFQKRCDERIYDWVDDHYIELSSDTQRRVEGICRNSRNQIQLQCLENRYKYYDDKYIELKSETASRAISYCTQEAVNSYQPKNPPQSRQDKLIDCVTGVVNEGLSERTALSICKPGYRRTRPRWLRVNPTIRRTRPGWRRENPRIRRTRP